MAVSNRVHNINVSPTMAVSAKAKELKSKGLDVINLSVGEPDFGTPDNINNAAIKAIEANHTKYTINSGIPELRQAIADTLKKDHDLDYALNEIIVSNGAKQSVLNVLLATVYVDDEVIIPSPYWVSYPEMVTLAMGKSVIVETDDKSNFKITPEQFEAAITPKTKALILCNPSNPTGAAYTKTELEAIAAVAVKHNIYVIADEIYEKLTYGDYKFTSFATLGEDVKKLTIIVNGVSKAYSMTGWRIGFAAGPADVVGGINRIQSHSTSNACSISQYAALEAYTGPQDEVEKMRIEFEKRRNYFHEELNSIEGISCNLPEGAFYLFPNISGVFNSKIKNSMDFALFLLEEAHVAAVPGSAFGAEGYLRCSYATSMENLVKSVARIKEVVAKIK